MSSKPKEELGLKRKEVNFSFEGTVNGLAPVGLNVIDLYSNWYDDVVKQQHPYTRLAYGVITDTINFDDLNFSDPVFHRNLSRRLVALIHNYDFYTEAMAEGLLPSTYTVFWLKCIYTALLLLQRTKTNSAKSNVLAAILGHDNGYAGFSLIEEEAFFVFGNSSKFTVWSSPEKILLKPEKFTPFPLGELLRDGIKTILLASEQVNKMETSLNVYGFYYL